MSPKLSRPQDWYGIWTALITPLNADLSLNEKVLKRLIDQQIDGGVVGIVIAGSTGEGSLLPAKTLEALFESSLAAAEGRIPLVAGLGIGGTEACLQQLRLARKIGMQGVLASAPAYIKAPQRGLVKHFLKVAEEGLPLCLYEVPGRAGYSLQDTTILEIARHSASQNIVALKDASGDLKRVAFQKKELGDRLALLSGEDAVFSGYLQAGGHGIISVVSHLALSTFKRIEAAVGARDFKTADALQKRLAPLIDALFAEGNPIPVKSWLSSRAGFGPAHFCPPLCELQESHLQKLNELAEQEARS